jgi:uncharacterized protein with HEPN domain
MRDVDHTLHDILETIARVESKVVGRTFDQFQADWEFRFAIQRAIEIVSEATRRLPDDLKSARPEIHWRSIAAIGNVLRHEYHTVSDRIVWNAVHQHFPPLKAAIEAIAVGLGKK